MSVRSVGRTISERWIIGGRSAQRGAAIGLPGRWKASRCLSRRPRPQMFPHEVEVRESEGGKRPDLVLGQAAIAHLRKAPEPFHDVESVFAARPNSRPGAVDHP